MTLEITPEVYLSMGLNKAEYDSILKLMGREPSYVELGMFAVMWSEHCGYKFSRPVLKLFKKYKEAMEGAGLENAGVVELGDGLGITMKVESHNHPSAVEPYQGAATGVGGIIRDILTMGARPIAALNSLRFGPIDSAHGVAPETIKRNRFLFEHVVAGIAGYGNCVGVPTVAGEVGFHPRYSGNPLVNAMCVGLVPLDKMATAAAAGTGNPVIYLGSATGKDGIHGATFASDALGEDSDEKRPNVQIGDPFAEKQLIEATLEALETGAIVAIQDMGAAGLTCSTVEMSSQGKVGMKIDLDLVPMRENDMTAYELMLSESQERMLAVAEKGREGEVLEVFHRWGLKAVVIGEVTDDGLVRVTRNGKEEVHVDPTLLTDHCPTYETAAIAPDSFKAAADFKPESLPHADAKQALLQILAWPEIASKRWVFRQYDQQVQTQTAVLCGQGDAAVLAPRGTKKGLALKIDGNERQVAAHPRRGGRLAVCEAARNVACTGAKPVAATDGLNFGNPTYPHVYWQFREAVTGIAEAAEALGTPVVSGNVSFYNESDLGEVPPTPLIGIAGVLPDASKFMTLAPCKPCPLYLLSYKRDWEQGGLGASAFAACVHGQEVGYPEDPDLAAERHIAEFLVTGADQNILAAAHDVSQGGSAVALAEIALAGWRIEADLSQTGPESTTSQAFGEFPGWVFVQPQDGRAFEMEGLAKKHGLQVQKVGEVKAGSGMRLTLSNGTILDITDTELRDSYEGSIPRILES